MMGEMHTCCDQMVLRGFLVISADMTGMESRKEDSTEFYENPS